MRNLCYVFTAQETFNRRTELGTGIESPDDMDVDFDLTDEGRVRRTIETARHPNSLKPLLLEDLHLNHFHELKVPLLAALKKLNEKIASMNTSNQGNPLVSIAENFIVNALDLNQPIHLYVILLCQLMFQGKLNKDFRYSSSSTAGTALLHFILLEQFYRSGLFETHLKQFNGTTGSCFQNYKVGKRFFHSVKAISHFKKYRIPDPSIEGITVEQLLAITTQSYLAQLAFFHLTDYIDI
jgi:hypothetical protein